MSPAAHLRFLGDLGELLPAGRRGRIVRYPFVVGPSVKDAIEALGVPHTEVGAVVANGRTVDLSHRLADGDEIAVHPRAVPPAGGAGAPADRARFLADVHLGRLARYLRLLGFDTRYEPGAPDERLAALAVEERRTLLTRDRGLLKRRAVTDGVLVRSDAPEVQAVEVVRRLGLGGSIRPFTRCMACNGTTEAVAPDAVAGRVPPRIATELRHFRACPGCGRVYWEGSHHDRLVGLVARIREAAAG